MTRDLGEYSPKVCTAQRTLQRSSAGCSSVCLDAAQRIDGRIRLVCRHKDVVVMEGCHDVARDAELCEPLRYNCGEANGLERRVHLQRDEALRGRARCAIWKLGVRSRQDEREALCLPEGADGGGAGGVGKSAGGRSEAK